MKFRNYKNSFNNSNRIFSDDDVLDMTLRTLFDKENDVLAQNRAIGMPTIDELQNSQNTLWVEPFVGNNGEKQGGFWQSILDNEPMAHTKENFLSTINNPVSSLLNGNNVGFTQPYTLTGMVKENVIQPIQEAVDAKKDEIYPKYEGLTKKAAIQKAAAKVPVWHSSEKEYYQHALKLADGEEPTDFMKENNSFRKIDEIYDPDLKQIYIEKAAKMYGLDINDPATYDAIKNTQIVIPKINSQLYNQIKNSKAFQKWIAENYENIKNNTNNNTSTAFPAALFHNDKRALYATIKNTDLKNSKINEDGSFSVLLSDAYDFENWEKRHYKDSKSVGDAVNTLFHNRIRPTNNRAKEQQDAGQLQRYLLSTQMNLTKEEVEEILRKYR